MLDTSKQHRILAFLALAAMAAMVINDIRAAPAYLETEFLPNPYQVVRSSDGVVLSEWPTIEAALDAAKTQVSATENPHRVELKPLNMVYSTQAETGPVDVQVSWTAPTTRLATCWCEDVQGNRIECETGQSPDQCDNDPALLAGDINGYILEWGATGGSTERLSVGNTLNYTLQNLDPGTRYQFRVSTIGNCFCVDAAGNEDNTCKCYDEAGNTVACNPQRTTPWSCEGPPSLWVDKVF